jgi:hypothetical protein
MECDDSESGVDHTGACLEDVIGRPAYPERGVGALEGPDLTHETDDRDPVDLCVFTTR